VAITSCVLLLSTIHPIATTHQQHRHRHPSTPFADAFSPIVSTVHTSTYLTTTHDSLVRLSSSSWYNNDDDNEDRRSDTSRSGRGGGGRGGRGGGARTASASPGRSKTRRSNNSSGRGRGGSDGRGGRGGGRLGSRGGGGVQRQTRNVFSDSDYDNNNNRGYNEPAMQRHQPTSSSSSNTPSIDCPHFGTCPGCVVNEDITKIDIIESAKLYFSSSSIQKHVLSSTQRRNYKNDYSSGGGGYYDEEEEEFYKVVVPSSTTQWRTQAKLAVAPSSTWSRAQGCKLGLYERYSHNVLSIPDCAVHHPSINRAVEMIVEATKKVRTPAFTEDTGEGLLRYVQLQVELSTGKICLTLVMNAEKLKECQPHLSFLVKELKRMDDKKEVWHSIWCHCNESKGNAIFSRDSSHWHPLEGPPYIREKIPGSNPNDDPEVKEGLLYFSPMVFRQGNLEGFGKIAKEVRESIPRGSKVCELYAGVGLLGLSSLLYHGKLDEGGEDGEGGLPWLRCSDENPENERCFERAVNSMPMKITGRTPRSFKDGGKTGGDGRQGRGGRQQRQQKRDNGEISMQELMDRISNSESYDNSRGSTTDPSERVTYMKANAASALFKGQALGADVLIVDPPRKGLDEPVIQQLCQPYNANQPYVESPTMLSHLARHTINWTNDVRTLIYVSCGFDALARDCDQILSSSAGWKLESATGYVLFPGSNHVETVVVFRR
jgi:tRNA/tmRNA/rRNA uracil-C5-methylase (TrmA/RlmC/RlmD family)